MVDIFCVVLASSGVVSVEVLDEVVVGVCAAVLVELVVKLSAEDVVFSVVSPFEVDCGSVVEFADKVVVVVVVFTVGVVASRPIVASMSRRGRAKQVERGRRRRTFMVFFEVQQFQGS